MAQKWRVARQTSNRNIPFAESAALEQCALRYVERYATTRAKLARYMNRKLRERGWAGADPPPVEDIVERFARLGYVDDQGFAEMRAASLARRGYGERRISMALQAAGIAQEDREGIAAMDDDAALEAALKFARRRRIGPFAVNPLHGADPVQNRRAFAAMVRAGHPVDLIRKILDPEKWSDFRDSFDVY